MLRKGVSAVIINRNNKFLLVNLCQFEPRFYAIPGGGLEENETLEDAVYREIFEELGIVKNSLEFVGVCKEPLRFNFKTIKLNRNGNEYTGSERHFFGFRFIGKDDDLVLQKDEVRSYKWVDFSELNKYLLFDNQLAETTEKIIEIFPENK